MLLKQFLILATRICVGVGAKYQLTKVLNFETLYSKFVRGNDTGLGQSFNLGLRALF